MRQDLQAMHQAGIRRARFSGRINLWDRRGFVALENVVGPIGNSHHLWVKPEEWHGPEPQQGKRVDVLAEIRQYFKGNGEEDFGLFDVRVLTRGA